SRVLKWIVGRLEGEADAKVTPIGLVPAAGSLDVEGLSLTDDQLDLLLHVDPAIWRDEAALIAPAYEAFGDRMPAGLWRELEALRERLSASEEGADSPSPAALRA
ncbi:MAG: phosphoenolpyruvate carboxykinase domain-containing protein, partial [Caulobacteraceae bacterium]